MTSCMYIARVIVAVCLQAVLHTVHNIAVNLFMELYTTDVVAVSGRCNTVRHCSGVCFWGRYFASTRTTTAWSCVSSRTDTSRSSPVSRRAFSTRRSSTWPTSRRSSRASSAPAAAAWSSARPRNAPAKLSPFKVSVVALKVEQNHMTNLHI